MEEMNIIKIALSSLFSAIISAVVSIITNFILKKIDNKNMLINELHNLMKYSMDYPFLENDYFTKQYNNIANLYRNNNEVYNCNIEIINRYIQYEIYCEMIFNYINKIYIYYNKKEHKISNFLDVYNWIKRHKQYWFDKINYKESKIGYGGEFVYFIDKIYKKEYNL